MAQERQGKVVFPDAPTFRDAGRFHVEDALAVLEAAAGLVGAVKAWACGPDPLPWDGGDEEEILDEEAEALRELALEAAAEVWQALANAVAWASGGEWRDACAELAERNGRRRRYGRKA